MNLIKNLTVITLATAIVYGCGGGGGGSAPATPDGIYSGSITGGQGAFGFNGGEKAVIYNNRMMLLSLPGNIQQIFDLPLTIDGTSLSGTMLIYDNSSAAKSSATASGSFVANQSATISFTNNSNPSIEDGTVNLTANTASFNQGSSLDLLSDGNPSWQGVHGGFGNSTAISFATNGDITGSDTEESCAFTGTTTIPDASKNLYLISIITTDAVNCISLPPATYTGFVWFDEGDNNTLNLIVADGNRSRAIILTRN